MVERGIEVNTLYWAVRCNIIQDK